MGDLQPGPVAEKIARDLAWLRVPDLSDFSQEEVDAEFGRMVSKSGITDEWVEWFQQAVRQAALGLITMETAEPGDVAGLDPRRPLFASVQRLKTPFRDQLLILNLLTRDEPVMFVDSVEGDSP